MEQFQCPGDPLQEIHSVPLGRFESWPRDAANFRHGREPVIHFREFTVRFPRVAPGPINAEPPLARRVLSRDVVLVVSSRGLNDGAHDHFSIFWFVVAWVVPFLSSSTAKRREVSQRFQAGQEEIGSSPDRGKCRQTLDRLADRPLWDFEIERAVMAADDWVSLIAEFMKVAVVHPHVLGELELTDETRTNDESCDTAFLAIVRRA